MSRPSRAAMLQEYEALDERIADMRRAQQTSWRTQRGQIERRIARLDVRLTELHRILFPPVIGDGPHGTLEGYCKVDGCEQEANAFEQAGYCDLHYKVATGTATPDDHKTLQLLKGRATHEPR